MKNIMKSVVLLLFLVLLLLYPAPIIASTKTGLLTWAEKVVPALFPFFVLTRLMIYYQVPQMIGKLFAPIFKSVLKISPLSFFVMFMSFISGNPSGPKMAREYYDKHLISERELTGLLYFCNFSSPLFIIGTIGVVLYQSTQIGYLLLTSHLLGSITVFILCYPYFKTTSSKTLNIEYPTQSFATILIDCIESSIQTLLRVGGIIVFFYIVSEAFNIIHLIEWFYQLLAPILSSMNINTIEPFFAGLLEFTQGVTKVASASFPFKTKLILTAFIVSFTGLSIHTQTFMFAKNLNVSYIKYLFMRCVHGISSALIVLFGYQYLEQTDDVFLQVGFHPLFILNPFVKLTLGFMVSYLILKPLQLIIHQMDRYKKAKR